MSAVTETTDMPVRSRIGYEEFLTRDFEGKRVEWVEGEIVEMSPVTYLHSSICVFLTSILSFYADSRQLGVVCAEPFQMKASPELPGRSPDVLFVSEAHHRRIRPQYLEGPADLVVEVVSPESRSRDRGEKFFEYAEGGVTEYWIVDPERRRADFYRNVDGVFQPMPVEEGVFRSEVMQGLWLRIDWLWQKPLPRLADVFRQWGLM